MFISLEKGTSKDGEMLERERGVNPAREGPGAGGETKSESRGINWKIEEERHISLSKSGKENMGEKGNFITREEGV